MAVSSIFSRKRDLCYLIYFLLHIPIMFLVDLQSIYPPDLVPAFMNSLRTWYIDTYADAFFTSPPAFFKLFMYLEIIYHVPTSLWAIRGLLTNDAKVSLVLLPYAAETFLTTLTCMADYMSWPTTLEHKINLSTLYGPYLALSIFMGVDMYLRLNDTINGAKAKADGQKKNS